MQVFDSNGPDVRIRGTAHQVVEKYLTLAKDAESAGDRIVAQSYLQHAEHYQRIINTFEEDVQGSRFNQERPAESFIPQPNQRQDRSADLSLPASILGGVPKADSAEAAGARTGEFVT